MVKRLSIGAVALTVFMLLAVLAAIPARAHHDADHSKGNEASSSGRDDCEQNKESRERYYDADCVPEGSENGGGGGGGAASEKEGGGRPCAGCVGKADNKNPPGQAQGEDNNKGYECDDNAGIAARRGSGNPAHTGCPKGSPTTTTTSPPPSGPVTKGKKVCDKDPTMPGNQECDGVVAPALVCDADPLMDGVQECGADVEPDQVCDKDPTMAGIQECGVLGVRVRAVPRVAPGRTASRAEVEGGVLPFTGVPIETFAMLGLALLATGGLLIRRRPHGRPSR